MVYVDTEGRQLVIMDRESARSWRSDDPWYVPPFNAIYGSPIIGKSFLYLEYLKSLEDKKLHEQSNDKRLF